MADPRTQPGRNCPLSYRYAPAQFDRAPEFATRTLYVAGGLYGNPYALDAVLALADAEPSAPTLVFNGDFHWFDVDATTFARISATVLQHRALRGNVETEIGSAQSEDAGCGCAYPESVSDAEVARSNAILGRLRATASASPEIQARLAALPMHLVAEVGALRIGIVHGDCEALAGWRFSHDALRGPTLSERLAAQLRAANVDVFASSHTCLPLARRVALDAREMAIVNNGAAGMPNFAGTRYGLCTRIALTPCRHATPLYGFDMKGVHIEALPLHYDHAAWQAQFVEHWPPGSPAHVSYFPRIERGPAYAVGSAQPRSLRAARATQLA